jgi:hypothetical protein
MGSLSGGARYPILHLSQRGGTGVSPRCLLALTLYIEIHAYIHRYEFEYTYSRYIHIYDSWVVFFVRPSVELIPSNRSDPYRHRHTYESIVLVDSYDAWVVCGDKPQYVRGWTHARIPLPGRHRARVCHDAAAQ